MNNRPKKTYNEEEISTLLDNGYISVDATMWKNILPGSHIRYLIKGSESIGERFRPGGFVRNSYRNDNDKDIIMLETKPGGKHGENYNYACWPVALESVEKIWKKYDRHNFIEISMIKEALAEKNKQIELLTERVTTIESILTNLVKSLSRS